MKKDYGLVTPPIYASHYFAGTLPKDILQIDGNWFPYLPQYESQAANFETFACTVFGTGHCVETLINKIFSTNPNYSERYIYNLVGITPPIGGDPQIVAETIRSKGMVDQGVLPMTDTLQEYEVPRPMTEEYISKGQAWLAEHSFLHEWLWTKTIDQTTRVTMMKEYLQYSPLAISVTAWYPEVNGMYPDNGAPNTHWVMCYGMDGDSPLIFDSYAQDGSPLKKLTPDHHIEMCKRYYIGLSTDKVENLSWIGGILKAIGQGITYVINQMKSIPQTPPVAPQTPENAPSLPETPQPAPISPTIAEWANLVGKWEGSSDGNLKLTTLTKSWGATAGRPAGDGGFFCKWASEAQGIQALCNFLTLAAEDQLIPYHNARTIKEFILKYTNFPKPEYDYSDNIIKELGVSSDYQISNFLT